MMTMMMCTPGLPVIMFIIVIISINYATLNTCCRPIFKPPLANAGALRSDALHLFVCLSVCLFICLFVCLFVCVFVCLSVRLSPVKFVQSLATWQHMSANGGLSYIEYITYRISSPMHLFVDAVVHSSGSNDVGRCVDRHCVQSACSSPDT